MKSNKRIVLSTKIFIGLALGIWVGILLRNNPAFATTYIEPFGKLFLQLLKMIIIPLEVSSLIMGACAVGCIKRLGKMGLKTLSFFLVTTAAAVVIGLIAGKVFNVGHGISIPVDANFEATHSIKLFSVFYLILQNPFKSLIEGNMLPIITFSLIVGVGVAVVGKKASAFKNIVGSFSKIMYTITGAVMQLAPYAVFALIVPVVSKNGPDVLLPLLNLIAAVYFACFMHALLVYTPAIKFLAKQSPIKFLKVMFPALLFAFSSSSSTATIPLTSQGAAKMGVKDSVKTFVIPLGATINIDGTAVFQGICTLFIATIYGVDLTIVEMITVILVSTLASIGTAGVPGFGTVMLGMALASVNLPLDGIALILGIESLLDMARTALNILGDATCAVIVASLENELDAEYAALH